MTVSMEDLANHTASYLMGDVQNHELVSPDGEVSRDTAMKQIVARHKMIHDIINIQASIYYHGSKHGQRQGPTGGMSYLLNLAKGTFDEECAPNLFAGGEGNLRNYYWLYEDGCPGIPNDKKAPSEFWMIFRNVFAETPGLKELLIMTMDIGKKQIDGAMGGGAVESNSDNES